MLLITCEKTMLSFISQHLAYSCAANALPAIAIVRRLARNHERNGDNHY